MKFYKVRKIPCIKRYALLLSLILLRLFVSAQDLLGKELIPEVSNGQILGMVWDRIREGNFSGAITSVKVIDDDQLSLKLNIHFTGYREGYIHAAVADSGKTLLKGIISRPVPISADTKDLSVSIEVDRKQYADNMSFVAPWLILTVSKNDHDNQGIQMIYKLNKKFTIPVSAENVVIPIQLIPVENAAKLPRSLTSDNAGFQLPQRKLNMIEKPALFLTVPANLNQAMKKEQETVQPVPQQKKAILLPAIYNVYGLPSGTKTGAGTTSATPAPSTAPQGPDNNPFSLWVDIDADVDFESQFKVTNINLNVYPDKNLNSGVFYYLPIAYDIKYNAEKGYAFHIDYGTSRSDTSNSRVLMSGTLTSGITLFESQFIDNLMDVFKLQNPQQKVERVIPMPLTETPVIRLSDELNNFGITNVHINNTSSISDPVEFSWITDGTTAAEIENLLKSNSGITGSMQIKPSGGNLPTQEIPVRIRLMDENTLGRFALTPTEFRTKNWRNETPFPIRLKYLHCLIIGKNKDGKDGPIIYSWDLNNQVIPPRAQVKFDASSVPSWLDNYKNHQARIWLDYSVVDSCHSCNDEIFRDIIKSTTQPQLSDVVFRVIPFFNDFNISYMDVQVKSLQGDPSGATLVNFPSVHISKDSADYTTARIYVPNGVEPAFQYRISVVTKTGVEMTSDWIDRNTLSVPFGSYQLQELFPSLKNTQ